MTDTTTNTRVLVTGGAGFIGSHLVESLVERGRAVRVLDDLSTGSEANLGAVAGRIEFVRGSVLEPGTVRAAMDGAGVVFHLAANVSVRASIDDPLHTNRVNVEGTLVALDAARRAGVRRFVLASSSAVYGDHPAPVKHEGLPARPISPYGASKLSAEAYALAYRHSHGLETVALRYFNVYGPRQPAESDYAAVIPKFVSAVLGGRRPVVFGDGEQRRDFVFVGDVVAANLAAMEAKAAAGQAINVATGRSISLNELVESLRAAVGRRFEVDHADRVPGDVRDSTADVSRAKEALGFEARVRIDEGLRRLIGPVGSG